MQTREELEEEIKTFKRLRRTHCKDAILGGIPILMCAPETLFYADKEPGIAIIAGAATLAGIIFSSENISGIREDNGCIKEAYRKMQTFNSY